MLLLQPVVITNMDFELFTAGGQPATLQNNQWVHFSNAGNSNLPEPIVIPGWTAHEYASEDGCNYGSNMAATGCSPCGEFGTSTSCGSGLFRQSAHETSLGLNVLFLNSGYVEQQTAETIAADTTYTLTCEVGGGNGGSNGGYCECRCFLNLCVLLSVFVTCC